MTALLASGCSSPTAADRNRADIDINKRAWALDQKDPEVYFRAVYSMLLDAAENGLWLTPGNVVEILGCPSSTWTAAAVPGQERGSIDWQATRLVLKYERRQISVHFSLSGLAESVVSHFAPGRSAGLFLPDDVRSPVRRADAPVIGGALRHDAEALPSLIREAEAFGSGLKTDTEWHALARPPPVGAEWAGGQGMPCTHWIAIADGVKEDLAIVTFGVNGRHDYFVDTWWVAEEGQWRRAPAREGHVRIRCPCPD